MGFPSASPFFLSLPTADMSTGVVAALDIMIILHERAKDGGLPHGNATLTAFQAAPLKEWAGLYQPEVVAKIQEKFKFKPKTSDLHVIELCYLIAHA